MDDLLSEFLAETAESLETLDVELVRLERNPNDVEILETIFRLVHTIKGTCGFLDLPRLETLAHAAESVLGGFRDGTRPVSPDAVSLILDTLDRIRGLLGVLEQTETEPEGDDEALIARLDAMNRAAKPDDAAAPVPETAAPPPAPPGTVYDRIGGLSTIDTAVELLYRKVEADPDLARYFRTADLIRLQGEQTAFLCAALGGPDAYDGADLARTHAPIAEAGLGNAQFETFVFYLDGALATLDVPDDDRPEFLQAAQLLRAVMVAPAETAGAEPARVPAAAPRPAGPSVAAPEAGAAESNARDGDRAKETGVAGQSIRVDVDLLDDLMTMVGELVLTRNELIQRVRDVDDSAFKAPLQRLSRVTAGLQGAVMKSRMQPIGNAWSKLPRIVRDLAIELDKKIDLRTLGGETELDRQVLDMIKDPLTHMVRNSGDHGIETPADRVAAGKPETGTIGLNARHEGGYIVIEVSDDGKGLSAAKIRRTAIDNGVATAAALDAMTESQIQQLIFRPGFSTAATVTGVSGRGVGMDVVRTNIERIGGRIELRSTEGRGATVSIRIPVTLAIVQALIVESGKQRFAIPQLSVVELVRISPATAPRVERIRNAEVLRLRDRLVPLVRLADLLELDGGAQREGVPGGREPDGAAAEERFVVVAKVGTFGFGLVVDRVFDAEEIVVKPVAPILRHIGVYSGTTILGDGSVIMILDPNGIADAAGEIAPTGEIVAEAAADEPADRPDRTSFLLFRAGTDEPRAVPLSLVARLEEIDPATIETTGGRPVVQYRGRIMPLVRFADRNRPVEAGARQPVIVFSDDDRSMGLLVDEIVDIVEDRFDIQLSSARAGILGSAIIGGRTTEVIDTASYLGEVFRSWFGTGQTGAHDNPARRGRVLVVDDSPFFRNLLAPLLTVAGYGVTAVQSAGEALRLRAAGERFDLILSDIEMPGMTGHDFARAVRSEGSWRQTPMVALSSHLSPADLERGRDAGFDDYVGKLDREALLNSISQTLTEIRGAA